MIDRRVAVVDTNVILRHLLNDHADHSPRAAALFLEVRRGKQTVYCPDTAIFEAIHILHGRAGAPRDRIVAALTGLIALPSFRMEHKGATEDALTFWQEQSALDYAKCYHLALTKALGMSRIYTFDRKMERSPASSVSSPDPSTAQSPIAGRAIPPRRYPHPYIPTASRALTASTAR